MFQAINTFNPVNRRGELAEMSGCHRVTEASAGSGSDHIWGRRSGLSLLQITKFAGITSERPPEGMSHPEMAFFPSSSSLASHSCNLLRWARRRHCSALCSVVLANQKGPIDNQTLFLRWLPPWTEDSRGADVREAEMEIGNCDCDVCHSHWDRLHHLFTLKHSCRAICLNLFLFSDWFFFCFLWLDISNILIWSFRRWLLFEPRKKSLLPVAVYFLKKRDMKVSFFFFLDGNVSDQTCSALWNRFRWEKKNPSMHLAEMFISWFLIEPWKAKSCFWLTPISTVRGRAVKREHILYCV